MLQDNQLIGTPYVDCLSLQVLDLSNNRFSRPFLWGGWSGLKQIRSIVLDNNVLTGNLPFDFSDLGTLQLFSARNNSLVGSLPSSWGLGRIVQSLTGLALANNQLTGALPVEWGNFSLLQAMSLGNNQLSGGIPEEWSALGSLKNLDLAKNNLRGSIPRVLDNLELPGSLVNIWLYDNPNMAGCWPSVEFRDLTRGPPGLTGSLFATENYPSVDAFGNIGQLSDGLECNNGLWTANRQRAILLSGKAALDPTNASAILAQWNSSTYPCNETAATWPGITGCRFDRNVIGVSLPSQGLVGTLPVSWSRMGILQTLDLSFNFLRGTLPAEWSTVNIVDSWTTLRRLNLRSNMLTGSLPPEWGSTWGRSGFLSLDFSYNQLNGSLPSNWTRITVLDKLAADGNMLTGPLPPQWSSLGNLATLSLAGETWGGERA